MKVMVWMGARKEMEEWTKKTIKRLRRIAIREAFKDFKVPTEKDVEHGTGKSVV